MRYQYTVNHPGRFTDYTYAFGASGWVLLSHSWGGYYDSNYTKATIWTFAHFQNTQFCPFGTTDAWYSYNEVYGWYNGQASGAANSWVAGGCTSLLHRYSVLDASR